MVKVGVEFMFIAVWLWKQPRGLMTDECDKMWHICIMEFYSVIKNEVMLFV
jgi:hypothetical protein